MRSGRIVVLTVVLVFFGTWACADECNNYRYVDNNDGTVTDCRTGLIWLKNANCTDGISRSIDKSSGHLRWQEAMEWARLLHSGHCGLNDGSQVGFWRLPTITEWMAMVQSAKKYLYVNPALTNAIGTGQCYISCIFDNLVGTEYWSSTRSTTSTTDFYTVSLVTGNVQLEPDTDVWYVWPVRAGHAAGNDASFGTVTIE